MSRGLILLIALLILAACAGHSPPPDPEPAVSLPPYAYENAWCGTLRGNGQQAPAHWASLARLTEMFGPPVALVGGSSSSITMFLTESILMNPYFSEAYFAETSPERYYEDVAFMFKSIEGYLVSLETIKLAKALSLLIN